MNSSASFNKFAVPGIALGLVTGLTVCTLSAAPATAGTVAAPAAITKAAAVAKAKPAFKSSDARYGISRSASVRNLQRALIKKRYANKALRRAGATGNYLTATRKSVALAQRRMGFSGRGADGIVGPTSAKRLGLRWVVTKKAAAPKKTASAAPKPVTSTPAPGLKVATYPGGRTQLSGASLKNVIKQAGFTGSAVCTAWGIAMRESGGYPGIMSPMNSNKTYDHGLFQLNDVHKNNYDYSRRYVASVNAKYAYTLSNRGTSFSHWGIGNQGWAAELKKQNKSYWQMLQDRAAAYTAQCNRI